MNGWSAVGGQTISAYCGPLEPGDGAMGHSVKTHQHIRPALPRTVFLTSLIQNPCGASTGSAVAVSAGFAPLALGTEVEGSLVQPAGRAGLYALKPTVGSTDMRGLFSVDEAFDTLGGMAKCVADLAVLTELVLNDDARGRLPVGGYMQCASQTDFAGLSIGFVDPDIWRWPETTQPQHEGTREEMVRHGLPTHTFVTRSVVN